MSDWTKPTPVSDVLVAFPASVAGLMPPMSDIPDEFKDDRSKWVRFQQDWFFSGLKSATWSPKAGVDVIAAKRHLACIQGSFEPKHEHKEAAVAYLASLWFDDVVYEVAL